MGRREGLGDNFSKCGLEPKHAAFNTQVKGQRKVVVYALFSCSVVAKGDRE